MKITLGELREMIREAIEGHLVLLEGRRKKKHGLWANIHARRKAGKRPKRRGEKGYPKTLRI